MCFLIAFLFIKSRLTAFVMRVFCEAQQFDGVNIDEEMVCQSVDWLVGNQRVDGALPEVQMVYHREMVVSSTLIGLLFGGRGAVWVGGAGRGGGVRSRYACHATNLGKCFLKTRDFKLHRL